MSAKYKATGLFDTNTNEVLLIGETASAVNELTVTNAATGTRPTVAPTGGDTNVGLVVKSKGTGLVALDDGTITGTAAAGAVTLNKQQGVITSEALTTAAGADYTLTITNNKIAATSLVLVSLANGTNTIAPIYVARVTPGAGSVVIVIRNAHASSALNGTIVVSFVAFGGA